MSASYADFLEVLGEVDLPGRPQEIDRAQLVIALSQAVSLKRIADAFDRLSGEDARNENGETPLQAIGAGISRALRDAQK